VLCMCLLCGGREGSFFKIVKEGGHSGRKVLPGEGLAEGPMAKRQKSTIVERGQNRMFGLERKRSRAGSVGATDPYRAECCKVGKGQADVLRAQEGVRSQLQRLTIEQLSL